MVWQDFAFACTQYPGGEAFVDLVRPEAEAQVERIRHRASLALWCGNNELEQGLVDDEWTDTAMSWVDYDKLYNELLPEVVEEIGLKELGERDRYVFYHPVATEENPTGYRGRTSIIELLTMTDPVRRLVMKHATSGEIQDQAVAEGMRTMYFDGLNKCLAGVTTLEEILRVTQEA